MSIQKQIDYIMKHHQAGNSATAIKLLEGMIRSAMSNKQARMAQEAINSIKEQQA